MNTCNSQTGYFYSQDGCEQRSVEKDPLSLTDASRNVQQNVQRILLCEWKKQLIK